MSNFKIQTEMRGPAVVNGNHTKLICKAFLSNYLDMCLCVEQGLHDAQKQLKSTFVFIASMRFYM